MLTIREVSQRLDVPLSTVRLWCTQGRLKGARTEESPFGGSYWSIPESALAGFARPERGRPKSKEAKPPTRKRGAK